MCVEDCSRLASPLSFGSTLRSGHILGGWRCRLNLFKFLLMISVGRFWSVQSVLEFNAIKSFPRKMANVLKMFVRDPVR